MKRRELLKAAVAGAAAAAAPRLRARAAQRPNLVFFLVDDQRYDSLGCAGHPLIKTPRIDALAAAGVRFSHAFVTTPICAASRASIFTGLTEHRHGYSFLTPPIAARIAQNYYPLLLRRAGYRTACIGKYGVQTEGEIEASAFELFDSRDRPYHPPQPDGSRGRHIDAINTEHAIDFIASADPAKPFALQLNFSSVHAEDDDKAAQYQPIDEAAGLYADVDPTPPPLADPSVFEALPRFLRESENRTRYSWRFDTPEKFRTNLRNYYRMVSGVDRMVGRVLDALAAKGLAGNTVVVYSSDNGVYLGERGFGDKYSHFEESIRVPLIVSDPRKPATAHGRVVDALALNIDLPATFTALAGLAPPPYQGRSLTPFLDARTPRWREGFFCEFRAMNYGTIPKWEGVRTRSHMYANYFEQQPAYEFVHDLRADPEERVNLATDPRHADLLARLRRETARRRAAFDTI